MVIHWANQPHYNIISKKMFLIKILDAEFFSSSKKTYVDFKPIILINFKDELYEVIRDWIKMLQKELIFIEERQIISVNVLITIIFFF